MSMAWTQDLSVGVERIDQQHKMLVDKANQLFEAGKAGKAKENLSQLLDFLDEYTKKHFSDEEQYMLSIHYPEFEQQKKMHTDFINELAKLKKDFNESGGNIVVIINANQMVVNWLINHISIQDKKIGAFVKRIKK